MARILGISGSLRAGSFNTALLRAAQELAVPGVELELATLHGVPLYDGDLEAREGLPPAVQALKARVLASDALLLATPEYNNGIPGVFKNAIDWLSRPAKDIHRVFGDRPVAMIGASSGRGGTRLAQAAWLPVVRVLGMRPWFGKQLYVAEAHKAFDDHGALTDEHVKQLASEFMFGFTDFVTSQPKWGAHPEETTPSQEPLR